MASWRDTGFGGAVMAAWALATVPLTVVAILLAVPFLGRRRAFFTVGPLFARGLAWFCRVPFTLQGWEQLPEDIRQGRQSVIFMSNHESQLDPPMLVAALPVPAVYIAKKELKYVPFIGWAGWAAGVIFIDRGDRERAIRSIHDAAQQIRGGKNVVIFPEGTRSRTGTMLPFKKGGFALALDAGVPIVPMATLGGHQVLPPGSMRIRPGRYQLRMGAPVHPSEYGDREALMKEVRARIEALVTEARSSAPAHA
ncbi:lysophospholipid acyltransferase family protein [Geothrix sp. PMB-07]|uniref:lysophospholipid acyltransferase family protein n=1 Tax=Geothrix sp. PMB-07 TaxID=3068640 RepID=UPI0027424883|nr:lysophospholipid acyltransferase family protein [Geothrix sp. PMB-07]WLT32451.1 lysophospholipid acyltransferase family protein [Geothrix sp. PMB-07]